MSEEREEVYQILELGKHLKNLHHKKGFGGLLFIDLSMIKFSKLSSYIRQLDKENQELKKQVETYKKLGFKHLQDKNNSLEIQQKAFIEYMNKTIEELECDDVGDEEMKGYLIQRIDTFKEILSKYKEIIGDINDKK